MRILLAIAVLLWAAPAVAADCRSWGKLDGAGKQATIEGMIEGHLNSNESKMWTSESKSGMRRCMHGFVGRIIGEFDDLCASGRRKAKNELDDIFDKYFLSCVQ